MKRIPAHIAIRAVYALSFSVFGVFIPFLPLILREQNLGDSEISLVLSSFGLAALISPLCVTHFADRHASVRKLLAGSLVGAAVILPLYFLVSTAWSAFAVTLAFYVFYTPIVSLLDSFTFRYLAHSQEPGRPIHFQSYRVMASFGFMCPAVFFLLLGQIIKIDAEVILESAFVLCLLAAVGMMFLPEQEVSADAAKLPSWEALQKARKPPIRDLLFATGLSSLSLSMMYMIIPRYFQELGCTTVQIGLIINLGVIFELILFPFTAKLVARFGALRLVMFGAFVTCLRLFILGTTSSIPLALFSQIFHAPMIMGFILAGPMLLSNSGDLRSQHSLQGLYVALNMGLSRLIGPLLMAWFITMRPSGDQFFDLQNAALLGGMISGLGALWLIIQSHRVSNST